MTKAEKRTQRLELALSELVHAADGFVSLVDIAQKESGKSRSHAFSELLAASRELLDNAKGTLDEKTIEKTLEHAVHGYLPNDYETTVRMINHGTTLRALQPKGKLCANIDRLVAKHFVKTPRTGTSLNGAGQNKLKQLFGWMRR